MKQVIFFSGPHGSGKTTLIENLISRYDKFQENKYDIDFLKDYPSIKTMNSFERCLIRLYHRYYVQNYSWKEAKKNNDSKITVVSRSVYDSLAYIDTYNNLNKFSDQQYSILKKVMEGVDRYPYTVILNPAPDIIMERLMKRREKGVRKERDTVFKGEDTYEFISKLYESFSKLKKYPNVLYIEDNGEKEIKLIDEWCQNKN